MQKSIFTYKSHSLGQAKPEPSREWWLWPGLRFEEAKATSGQAKAGAFRPSRAVHITSQLTINLFDVVIHEDVNT